MGGKEEVGWRVGKEKRQWVERSEGGAGGKDDCHLYTNWLLQSTQFKHTCVSLRSQLLLAVLLERKT